MEPIHGLSPFLFLANQIRSTVDKYLQNFYIIFQYFCITWAEISWWSSIQYNSEKAILKKETISVSNKIKHFVKFCLKKEAQTSEACRRLVTMRSLRGSTMIPQSSFSSCSSYQRWGFLSGNRKMQNQKG